MVRSRVHSNSSGRNGKMERKQEEKLLRVVKQQKEEKEAVDVSSENLMLLLVTHPFFPSSSLSNIAVTAICSLQFKLISCVQTLKICNSVEINTEFRVCN